MAKTIPNGAKANDTQSVAFEIRLPADLGEEALADFGDALEEFVGRFGYEIHMPTQPVKTKTKPLVKTSIPTSPR